MPRPNNTARTAQQRQKAIADIGLEMGHVPPQALDVEEAVLGAMLLESSCVDEAMESLTPGCFYDERHRLIFEAMTSLVNDHVSIDILTVGAKLKEQGNLEKIGGTVVLAGLSDKVGSAAHMEYYVRILKQKTIQRDLITAATQILGDAYDDGVKVDELIDTAQSRVYEAIQNNVKKDVQDIKSVITQAMNRLEKMQTHEGLAGVPSGYPSIDRITNGWQNSDLIILAARPSVGKTAFALNIARNAAVDHHIPVAIFSLEMSGLQLAMRLMTSESGLSADKIKGGVKLQDDEWNYLETAIKNLANAPLYIDETPGLPLMEFRTKVKNLVKQKGVRLVVVDYLQLMQGPADYRGMREQEVAAISRMLKATAKELNIPIIALSQLSRAAVQRQASNGKPQLSDLRESGSIEQDADMVIFIHRPDFLGMEVDPSQKDMAQIIIAKHRNGETRDIDMVFKSDKVRFMEVNDVTFMQEVGSSMNADDFAPGESYFDAQN